MGDTGGGEIGGGSVANSTDLTAALDGGTGIADASGGEYNIAFTLDPVPPAPAPEPDPDPLPPPPPPEIDEFQVCLTTPDGTGCAPGACTGAAEDAECTVPDCSTLPGNQESPCSFSGCQVTGNVGNCENFPA